MKKIIIRVIAVGLALLLAVVGLVGWKTYRLQEDVRLNNVVLESSDGLWMDFTEHFKGRDFRVVLWDFEAYKLLADKPEVTLIRVTRRQVGARDEIEWKVPIGNPSGRARPFLTSTTAAQQEEISRRAMASLEYWEKK